MSTLKKYCQNPKDIGTTPLFPFHSNRTPSPCIWEERFEQLAASKLLQLTLHFLCQWFPAILLPPHLSHGTLEYCLLVQTTDASSYLWKTKEKHTILLTVAWRLSLRYRKFSPSKNYFRVNQLCGLQGKAVHCYHVRINLWTYWNESIPKNGFLFQLVLVTEGVDKIIQVSQLKNLLERVVVPPPFFINQPHLRASWKK